MTIIKTVTVAICLQLLSAQEPMKSKCREDATTVLITAQEVSRGPRGVILLVTNLGPSPLVNLVLGEAVTPRMRVFGPNVPEAISGPTGWSAQTVFREESKFMYYFWAATSLDTGVRSGSSSCAFKISFRDGGPLKRQFFSDGVEAKMVDFDGLPFRAAFQNGDCVTSKVGVHRIAIGSREGER